MIQSSAPAQSKSIQQQPMSRCSSTLMSPRLKKILSQPVSQLPPANRFQSSDRSFLHIHNSSKSFPTKSMTPSSSSAHRLKSSHLSSNKLISPMTTPSSNQYKNGKNTSNDPIPTTKLFYPLPSSQVSKSTISSLKSLPSIHNKTYQSEQKQLSDIHQQSQEMVSDLLGKSRIPSHLLDIMHLHCLPSDLMTEIRRFQTIDIPQIITTLLHHTIQPPLQNHPWKFHRTSEAAAHNAKIIKSFNFDMEKATQSTPNTILSYGSEFKPWAALHPLLKAHPQRQALQNTIIHGISYPLIPIDEQSRLIDLEYMIARGNHKSAQVKENDKSLDKAFDKEIHNCWMLPIPIDIIKQIPGASVTPLGVAVQFTINEKGVEKKNNS